MKIRATFRMGSASRDTFLASSASYPMGGGFSPMSRFGDAAGMIG